MEVRRSEDVGREGRDRGLRLREQEWEEKEREKGKRDI